MTHCPHCPARVVATAATVRDVRQEWMTGEVVTQKLTFVYVEREVKKRTTPLQKGNDYVPQS